VYDNRAVDYRLLLLRFLVPCQHAFALRFMQQ
jgi:hypothetical protein